MEDREESVQHFLDLIKRSRRGKFKIYIGMIAGAGKGAISGGKGVAAASGAAVGNIAGRIKGRFFYTRTRSGSRADRGTRFGLCGGGTQARAFS